MAGESQPGTYPLSAVDVDRIAEAFELPNASVLRDRLLVDNWQGSQSALLAALRERHDWDQSIPPYYVYWLRGRVGEPPGSDETL